MPIHFLRDINRVKIRLLELGGLVEDAVDRAIAALTDRKPELAVEVLRGDDRIDAMEVAIEDECLKILALHHPVAGDLRFVVVAMKVNNDLERMGDHAVSIAERAADLAQLDPLAIELDFRGLGDRVRTMLRESLDSLVRLDVDLAARVTREDVDVDALHRRNYDRLEARFESDPTAVHRGVHLLSASRHLERIADLATNIAEDVVFMVRGEVVRHVHPLPQKP
jgi:phosphate transport system protein